jgi:hypothetical protein
LETPTIEVYAYRTCDPRRRGWIDHATGVDFITRGAFHASARQPRYDSGQCPLFKPGWNRYLILRAASSARDFETVFRAGGSERSGRVPFGRPRQPLAAEDSAQDDHDSGGKPNSLQTENKQASKGKRRWQFDVAKTDRDRQAESVRSEGKAALSDPLHRFT